MSTASPSRWCFTHNGFLDRHLPTRGKECKEIHIRSATAQLPALLRPLGTHRHPVIQCSYSRLDAAVGDCVDENSDENSAIRKRGKSLAQSTFILQSLKGSAMSFTGFRNYILLIATALFLTACGGGGDDGPAPLLEIGGLVNGQPIAGLDVLAGTRQALFVPFGQSFELDANRPVTWDVIVAGTLVPGSGNTITTGGTSIQETLITDFRFAASTFGFAPVPSPLQITIIATSLEDPRQVATVDVLVTN